MSTKLNHPSFKISMSTQLLKYLVLLPLIFILSCGEEDVVQTDVELQPYFDIFKSEAEARGFTVDYEAERIEGLIQDIPDASIQGQCFRNESKPRKVIIDLNYWNNATKADKEFIIFHELGHCFLNRDHLDESNPDNTCVSIMHSNPGVCNFNLNEDNREEYLDELFLN